MSPSEPAVSERIRTAIDALAEKHGEAEVIARDALYLFVDMGVVQVGRFDYDQDEARIILRIHQDFPDERHYGMVTVPVLTVDGRDPDNTTRNHQQAQALRQVGIEDYLYWSRDWREISPRKATDLAKATAFVRGTLSNPFDDS